MLDVNGAVLDELFFSLANEVSVSPQFLQE
jgi:hypothetical protein